MCFVFYRALSPLSTVYFVSVLSTFPAAGPGTVTHASLPVAVAPAGVICTGPSGAFAALGVVFDQDIKSRTFVVSSNLSVNAVVFFEYKGKTFTVFVHVTFSAGSVADHTGLSFTSCDSAQPPRNIRAAIGAMARRTATPLPQPRAISRPYCTDTAFVGVRSRFTSIVFLAPGTREIVSL